jgi:hypothetical protein
LGPTSVLHVLAAPHEAAAHDDEQQLSKSHTPFITLTFHFRSHLCGFLMAPIPATSAAAMPCETCGGLSAECWRWPEPTTTEIARSAEDGCGRCSIILGDIRRVSAPWEADVELDELGLRVLPLSTGHRESLEKLQSWLTQCLEQHPACESARSGLPRRVIDVGDPSDTPNAVRLYESQGENAKYICLSYRWPETAPVQLLRRNSDQFKAAIPYDELPLTFKQVFMVARGLNIRYVWIDALCIVQDEDAANGEKTQDIATMNLIYRSATLTLISAWSTEQMFSSVDERYRHHEVETGHPGSSERGLGVFVSRAITHYFNDEIAKAALPVMDRAWIFQERILSRRAVYFTRHELIWDCETSLRCQCHEPEEHTLNISSMSPNEKFRTLTRVHGRVPTESSLDYDGCGVSLSDREIDPSGLWWKCVREYSILSMSDPNDRLRAIQGIAAHVQTKWERGKYLAGLWEDTLLEDLCWFRPDRLGTEPRPKARDVPTWSWASIDSEVCAMERKWWTKKGRAEVAVVDSTSTSTIARVGIMPQDSIISIDTEVVDAVMRFDSDEGEYAFYIPGADTRFLTHHWCTSEDTPEYRPDHDDFERVQGVNVRLLKMIDADMVLGPCGVWLAVRSVAGDEKNLHERIGRLVAVQWGGTGECDIEQQLLGSARKMEVLLK